MPGAEKLFDRNSRREVASPIDEVGNRVESNGSDQLDSAHRVEQSHTEGGDGASGSGALKGQNSSTISHLERAQQKPDPSSPKGRKNETKSRDLTRQS